MSMRSVLVGSLVGVSTAGGSLKLSFTDCGDSSTHGHITSLTPNEVTLGSKTSLAGTGTMDEDIKGATYNIEAKALGITVFKHSGDACKPETIKLPAGAGTIDMKGLNCPLSKGNIELDLDLTLSASIPASLARTTIDLTATTTSGDKALCVEIKTAPASSEPTNYKMMFENFKDKYSKVYNGDDEESKRFDIFKANVDFIHDSNAQQLSYTLGVNQFTDLTAKEFGEIYMGYQQPASAWGELPYLGRHNYTGGALPDAVDWSTKDAVTPIKNQGQCGSCWSFSTTGSLEGAWQIATGKLVSLSEQQFVDCDKVDQGCNGGLMDNAFKYAEQNAICTEESYAYKGKGGTCQATSCSVGIPKGGVTGYKDVAKDDKQAMMEAVAQQPVSIAIQANLPTFQLYKSGILGGICGATLDHGVLAVGYGTDNGKDYWKVKNSWGPTWGDEGYIRLLRGKSGSATGECGLLSGPPSYPVVKASEAVVV